MASSKNIDDGNEFAAKWQETVGVKFNPTDEVLAGYYLDGKVSGCTDGPIFQLIKEVDIYQHDPSNLKRFAYDFGGQYMYFFTTLEVEYRNGTNFDRLTPGGCWKKTTYPCYIKDENRKVIAARTSFAYYMNDQKSGKPVKTQWFMKEYTLVEKQTDGEFSMLAPLTLCVVYFLEDNKRKDCETRNEYYDNQNNQSSIPDSVKGSSQTVASASSSGSALPKTQNSNPDCQQSPVMSSADYPVFPGKRHCPDSDLHEIFSNTVSISPNENQGQESSSNKPVATVEIELAVNNIPFANPGQNMLNPVMGSLATTNSSVQTPNHNQTPFLDPNMNIDDEILFAVADLFSNDY